MMVHAKGQGYRLSAYLNQFDCSVTLASGQEVRMDKYRYTESCLYEMDHMVHELWVSGTTEMEVIKDTVGLLRIEYRLFSFEGQGAPNLIECVVPVLARGVRSQR
jgi:hypothetical protein